MEWLNTLIKKLPTLKGIGDFFYVATHWSTISAERDEYRRQIKDREEWHQSYKTNVEAIHDIEKKRIEAETQETQQQIDTIAAQEQIMGMLGQRLRNLSADQTLRETLLESLPLSVNRNKKP